MPEALTRTVSVDDLARLKRERDDADARYNAALTAVDQAIQRLGDLPHPPPGPDEHQVTPLNRQWALPLSPPAATGWRGRLARFVWAIVHPALAAQQEFNGLLVDHVNRGVPRERAVTEAIAATLGYVHRQVDEAARFQSHLIVYLQTLTPYVDTKDYEFASLARRVAEDAQVALARLDDVARGLAAALSGLSDEMLKRYESLRGDGQRVDMRLTDLTASVTLLQQASLTMRRELARGLAAPAAGAPAPLAHPAAAAAEAPQQMLASDPIDSQQYASFEDAYRGSEADIRARMADYVPIFTGASDVVDLGCGRGEFLRLLREAGISARGIDLNHEMVERCRTQGFTVDETDGLTFLRKAPAESVGGLMASQVVEHLAPDYLLRLLAAAAAALKPGAPIVLETINPACWSAFFDSYIRDLTHVRPVHPDTLKFLVMAAGFTDVRVQGRSPYPEQGKLVRVRAATRAAAADAPALLDVADVVDRHADRLNELFFTDRDYAVIARRP